MLLLRQVERRRTLDAGREPVQITGERAEREIAALPERVRALAPADPPYQVSVSAELRDEHAGDRGARGPGPIFRHLERRVCDGRPFAPPGQAAPSERRCTRTAEV